MPVPFREVNSQAWQQYQYDLSSTQLRQPVGAAIEAALGLQKDFAADRIRYSIKAKFPNLAPPDALANIGFERGMPQGVTESSAAYASRLQQAWTLWQFAGTAFGMLRILYLTGYPNVVIAQVTAGNQFTLDTTGTILLVSTNGKWTSTFIGDPFWSRFDIIFPAPLPALWIANGVPSSSSSEANFIRGIIQSWKSAQSTPNRIIIITSGKSWGYPASQAWGAGTGNWGGAATVWTP